MTDHDYHCKRCREQFHQRAGALGHAIRQHGMTRQQAQNELKLLRRKR